MTDPTTTPTPTEPHHDVREVARLRRALSHLWEATNAHTRDDRTYDRLRADRDTLDEALLAAAGLLANPTARTEWGVRCDDAEGDVIESDDRKDAERIKAFYDAGMDHGHALVRRTVTDWTPVEESSDD
jgi:hypothetical protein